MANGFDGAAQAASGVLNISQNSVVVGNNSLGLSAGSLGGNPNLLLSTSVSTGLLQYNGSLYIALANDSIVLPQYFNVNGSFGLSQVGSITTTTSISAGPLCRSLVVER